jgi:hypothetical protein
VSGSDAEAENCHTVIDDDYRIVGPAISRAGANESRLREMTVKKQRSHFEIYRLYLDI